MSEARWTLTFEPMPPRPGEPDPSVRVRRLLKFAKRALRLRCVGLKEPPPDPCAYVGWVWGRQAWVRTCCGATPEFCEKMLDEAGFPGKWRQVLPRGEVPG